MRPLSFTLTFFLFPVLLAAQSTPGSAPASAPKPPPPASAPVDPDAYYKEAARHPVKIARASEVADWLKAGTAVLIDVRSAAAFKQGHLRGAVNLPATELTGEALRKAVPAGARAVIYCDDNLYPTRRVALTTLCYPAFRALGLTDVFVLQELWSEPRCRADKAPHDFNDPCPLWLPMAKPDAAK